MGAWIETLASCASSASVQSHPSWVRGLKPTLQDILISIVVAPLVGAWIETRVDEYYNRFPKSHPSWVRGLKPRLGKDFRISKGRTPRGCVD